MCSVSGAEKATSVSFEYEIGRQPFSSSTLVAEKKLMLFRFQLYGTKERFETLGMERQEILSSFQLLEGQSLSYDESQEHQMVRRNRDFSGKVKKCINCGAELSDENLRCARCGSHRFIWE